VWILGINWKLHDSSAALVDGAGRIWALAEEERFTRVKHAWGTFPAQAAQFCLSTAGITWRDLDVVAMGWDLPRIRSWDDSDRQLLYTALFGSQAATASCPELVFVEHHLAHALSSFYASGYDRAGVLVADGSGEFEAMSIYAADRSGGLTLKRRWPRGYSLGSMYEAATRLLGFGYFDAGKTMGLAPYGAAHDSSLLPLGDLVADGTWATKPPFDLPATAHYTEFTDAWMTYLAGRFGAVTHPADQLDTDPAAVALAASAQRTVEEAMRALHAETVCLTGWPQVCLAGGVALNCVANGRLPEPIFVPPFPHDAGVALGAAWSVQPPTQASLLDSPYLGSDLTVTGELDQLHGAGYRAEDFSLAAVVDLLIDGAIGAVAEGRAEAGPRALGHRSVVALPVPSKVRDKINVLKGREPWRPLAPVTLPEYAGRLWPGQGLRELYMVGTAIVSGQAHRAMPAATHVDGTTRPQVLRPGQARIVEGLLHGLASAGVPPVLVNTSFNGRGAPIVDSAAHAVEAFRTLGLDFLILGDNLVRSIL
jgi:carbamoyltransferase